jgi:hypothetical protein
MNPEMPVPEAQTALLHRREALKRVSALFGGMALVGGSALFTACSGERTPRDAATRGDAALFTDTDIQLLDDIADTILPTTAKSPGARAANVGPFIALMVTDCYTPADQEIFRRGIGQLDAACRAAHNTPFVSATDAQRLALLEGVDREAKEYMDSRAPEAPAHYFRMVKQLTLLGYFTSEIGATKSLRYIESPGRFDPCVQYIAGDPSWAAHGASLDG